jgi:ABC-type branched-subunit amino acid transport system permease subunit
MLEPFIISGLAVGSLYALSGVGMLVLYRTTGVLNLAYGALGAMAALISWQMLQNGAAEWTAYAVGVGVAGGASLLYGSLLGPYLAEREPAVKAMASLGFGLAILGVLSWYWIDNNTRTLTLPTDTSGFDLGDVHVSTTQWLAFALAAAITAVTAIYLRRSMTGTSMRALADDRELSSMLGVRVRRVESLAWLVSGVLGGVSGLLLADLTQLDATTLTFLVVPALAACVVGRFRSLWWTLFGGLLVGVLEAIATPYSWITSYSSAAPFVVAIALVLYLQRHKVVTIGSRAMSVPAVRRGSRSWRPRTAAATIAVLVAVGFLVPAVFSVFWIRAFTTSAIYAIACAGVGLLYGRLGLVSLGQIALVGVGGWITLRLGHATGMPFPLLLAISGVGTCAIGVMVGLPALRLSGLNLAIVTLMFAGAFAIVFTAIGFPDGGGGFLGTVTGSAPSIPLARPSGAASNGGYFRYVLVVAALMFAVLAWQLRGRAGRQWAVIRQSEAGALAAGVDTTRSKLWALALVSFTTGVAGGLLAANAGVLDPESFGAADSIILFAAVLIGGQFSLLGAAIAGLLSQAFPSLLSDIGVNGNLILVVFGLGLVQAVSTAPLGVAGQLQGLPAAIRRSGRRVQTGHAAGE